MSQPQGEQYKTLVKILVSTEETEPLIDLSDQHFSRETGFRLILLPVAAAVPRVEESIGETLTFYRLPLQRHKHMKSTNLLERFHEEIKRRTRVVRIFPNGASCLRFVRTLAVETHEGWLVASPYLTMDLLKEHQKLRLSLAA